MSFTFSAHRHAELRRFWDDDNFIKELAHHMEYSSKLIITGNNKSENVEKTIHSRIATKCKELIKELKKVPAIERTNELSLREERTEFNGRTLPICDPLEYVEAIMELAKHRSCELNKLVKYERQIHELDSFIVRFPKCRNLPDKRFEDLFCILYQPEADTDDKFRERVRKAIPKFRRSLIGKK